MRDVIVVGAGLAGLTAALRLLQRGQRPIVFEQYAKSGGLARSLHVNGEPLEAFYHHIFTSDTSCVGLAAELGLEQEIEWLPSRMGIWTDDRLWDFGTPLSLLRFRPLPVIDKIRFVVSTLKLQRISDPKTFESVTAAEWLLEHQGEAAWRSIWSPLLEQKFGTQAKEVSMAWLWGKLYLRGRSRSKSGMGERLGYMRGSFSRLVEALEREIVARGGRIELGNRVERIERTEQGFEVHCRKGSYEAARVLAATQIPDFRKIAGHLLTDRERDSLRSLKATSAICTILEMNRSLTPYYWLNIADPSMPFGGLIEHTNYISPDRYGGLRILYISNYLFQDEPMYSASKQEVLETYYRAIARINPEFDPSWVERSHHARAESAQPVVTVGYRDLIPDMQTSVPGLFLCSMAQIYPEDRGMNYAIAYGEKAVKLMMNF